MLYAPLRPYCGGGACPGQLKLNLKRGNHTWIHTGVAAVDVVDHFWPYWLVVVAAAAVAEDTGYRVAVGLVVVVAGALVVPIVPSKNSHYIHFHFDWVDLHTELVQVQVFV